MPNLVGTTQLYHYSPKYQEFLGLRFYESSVMSAEERLAVVKVCVVGFHCIPNSDASETIAVYLLFEALVAVAVYSVQPF
jgi:hypothetical protein